MMFCHFISIFQNLIIKFVNNDCKNGDHNIKKGPEKTVGNTGISRRKEKTWRLLDLGLL